MFKPTIPAVLCVLGIVSVAAQAADTHDIGALRAENRMLRTIDPIPLKGIDNNRLAADFRVMARIPGGHEAYGWRYPDAFASSPPLMKTRETEAIAPPIGH